MSRLRTLHCVGLFKFPDIKINWIYGIYRLIPVSVGGFPNFEKEKNQ